MDVERVQKISNLALELMKQGLAQNKEDAVAQAEKLLAKKDYSSLQDTMKNVQEVVEEQPSDEKSLGQDEIKQILERNVNFVVKKLKEYREEIDTLKNEINSLRMELQSAKSNINDLQRRPVVEAKSAEPQQKLETPAASGSGENHPRSGNFVENDVSIEKFFYAGNKS